MNLSLFRVFAAALIAVFTLLPAATAGAAEWKSPSYNFAQAKIILFQEPEVSFNPPDQSSNDYFKQYPYAREKVAALVGKKLEGVFPWRIVNRAYVETQVRGDPALPLIEELPDGEMSALLTRELPKHVDLVLSVKVRNLGWYYEFHEAYDTTETRMEKVRFSVKDANGKKTTGWTEVPITEVVHHPARHEIYDCAAVTMTLTDPRSGQVVWSYDDERSRGSFSWSGAYDKSGPESMLNRILDAAFPKLPIVRPAK